MKKEAAFIVVTGGVISGLGKGLFVASLGTLLTSQGYRVFPIKIDPYVNVDAGTMNPFEHGEVFVLDDGNEVDMDLGVYERFMNVTLTHKSNITTGKIFQYVIEKERRGDYLGKTVQPIPGVTGELRQWYNDFAREQEADIVLIEVGGTVGDIENQIFLESLRELSLSQKVLFVHTVLVPVVGVVGEQKTKPAQQSVRALREMGIVPNFLYVRSEKTLTNSIREKLSLFCGVTPENIFSGHDLPHIYTLPLTLEQQDVELKILKALSLTSHSKKLEQWKTFVDGLETPKNEITIALPGKYTALKDAYASVVEALTHAGVACNTRIQIHWIETSNLIEPSITLKKIDGILVPGGFGSRGIEGKLSCIHYAREHSIPFLGLCLGFQLAVIEYARNVCGLSEAHSSEFHPGCKDPVIDLLESQKQITEKGGSMRLGSYPATLQKGSKVRELYDIDRVNERHRHRYEVNTSYKEVLEDAGLLFSGMSPDGTLMEFLEISGSNFFIATQSHPEFLSRPLFPHPLFTGFVRACLEKQQGTL